MGCIMIEMIDEMPSKPGIRVGNGQTVNENTTGDINITYKGLMNNVNQNIRRTNYMQSP